MIDVNRDKIYQKNPGTPFLTTKRMKKSWNSWKQNQLTRNWDDTNQIFYDM